MWATVRHDFAATSSEEIDLKKGETVFVLQELQGKQWCIISNLKYQAGWAPCNHLGSSRVADVAMLASLEIAIRKHVQGKITSEELGAIAAVYETASTADDPDGEESDRQKYLLALEASLGDTASAGVLAAVEAALAGQSAAVTAPTSSLQRTVEDDLIGAHSISDPFAFNPTEGGYMDPSPAEDGIESPASGGDSPDTTPNPPPSSRSPGKKAQKKKIRKSATVWTWSEAVTWLIRTYELPQDECDSRMSELVRFGFGDGEAAAALVQAAGDVDKATVILVNQS